MTAIFKREINAYFDTPLGYVFLAVYYLFAGYFFYNYNLYANSTDMRALFEILFTVTLFLVPILTMRLMSEDRRNKTDQLLMMAPIGTLAIVMGKLLAAAVVYLAAMLITIVEAFVLSVFAAVEWSVVIGHFIGLFLLGLALISVGMLISTAARLRRRPHRQFRAGRFCDRPLLPDALQELHAGHFQRGGPGVLPERDRAFRVFRRHGLREAPRDVRGGAG